MANKILTKSDKFTSEYCCSIVRIGECFPIEGKDKIQRTMINGENIVISKEIKTGDLMLYASNETQLNKDFLGANNLFEANSYELNANAEELKPKVLMKEGIKKNVERWEKDVKQLKKASDFLTKYETEKLAADGNVEKIGMLDSRYHRYCGTIYSYCKDNLPNGLESDTNTFINVAKAQIVKYNLDIKNAKKEIEEINADMKRSVGFFAKTGRVRALRLGGVLSMGFLFTPKELAKWKPCVNDINFEELVGEDFDTIDGEEFIKAYVPYVPQRSSKGEGRDRKRNKKVEQFDRMVKGEFSYHYDTQPLPKTISAIKPDDVVTLSAKLHGTSVVIGKLKVKNPIKLPIHKALWNKFVDLTGLFKSSRITDYVVDYGNVTSSRTVIKNQYINKDVNSGYYGVDVWSEYGNLIYPYLDNGMTIYGEIVGYLTGSDKMIQKQYDYGCEVGHNKLMVYRITTTKPDGSKYEWNVSEVREWTDKFLTRLYKEGNEELAERIHPIDILHHGTLAQRYPDLSLTDHWHENVLMALRNDKELHMEEMCPMCKNTVPFEGIVLRKDDDPIAEAYKLKCYLFLDKERADIDSGQVDTEMAINQNGEEA